MKIADVKAHPPSWTRHEITTEATLILVEVGTDAGVIGYGEIQGGPLPLPRGQRPQIMADAPQSRLDSPTAWVS